MALSFPTSPTPGQVYVAPNGVNYTWNATLSVWTSTATNAAVTTVGATAPLASTGGTAPTLSATLATAAQAAAGTSAAVLMTPQFAVPKDAANMTGAALIPGGVDADRPLTPVAGMLRFNSTSSPPEMEFYNGTQWLSFVAGGSTVTSVGPGGIYAGLPSSITVDGIRDFGFNATYPSATTTITATGSNVRDGWISTARQYLRNFSDPSTLILRTLSQLYIKTNGQNLVITNVASIGENPNPNPGNPWVTIEGANLTSISGLMWTTYGAGVQGYITSSGTPSPNLTTLSNWNICVGRNDAFGQCGTVNIDYAPNLTTLENFWLNTPGSTVGVTKPTFTIKNAKLSADSVNNLLINADYSSSASPAGNGMQLDLSGGTSAGTSALTAAGIAARNSLVAKNWTITLNP